MMGYRKFLMGAVGLTLLVIADLTMLRLLLTDKIPSEKFVDFVIESCKVIGIIVAAFMASNMAGHIIRAIKGRIGHGKK